MKRLILYLVLFCALAGLVSAALTAPSTVKLGGENWPKSNPDEDDRDTYADTTFTITNNNATATNVVISAPSVDSKYNISFIPSTIASLAGHSSAQVTVKAIVPKDLDTYPDKVHSIGTISISADGGLSATSALSMQAENTLELNKVYVQINDGSKKGYEDGDNVESIRPGDRLTVEVRVKNRFSSNDNVDFDNVEVELTSDNSDFDIDDTLDFGTIGSGKEKTKSLTYTVDSSIDEETYTVEFELTGDDDYDSHQGQKVTIDFDVEKESEDIAISSAVLSPETLKCDRDTSLSVRLENLGSDDSDQVVLQWESQALGIKGNNPRIELNSGDATFKTIPLSIPSGQKAGTYIVKISTFFDYQRFQDLDLNDYAEVQLKVEDCVQQVTCYSCQSGNVVSNQYSDACPTGWYASIPQCEAPEQPKQNVTVVTPPPTTVVPTTPTGAVPVPVTYKPATSNLVYIGLIVLGYVIVIIIGIALISYIVRKR